MLHIQSVFLHCFTAFNDYLCCMKWKWLSEIVFWIFTIAVAVLIMRPIHDYIGKDYPYYFINYIFILLFFTYTRYLFLLRFTPFSHNLWVKLFLLFACIPLFLYLIDGSYDFQRMVDETGIEPLVNSSNLETKFNLARYVKYEFIFFSTGAFITLILLPMRMVASIWRVRNNKGKV